MPSRRLVPPENALVDRVVTLTKQVRQQAAPTGSQNNRNAEKVQEALDKLAQQVLDLQQVNAELQATVAYQASLVTVANQAPSFNSGTIPNDGANHWLTIAASLALSITVPVPTGRALVSYGCSEMSVQAGGSTAQGLMGFDLNDDNPDYTTRVFVGRSGFWMGAGVSRSRAIDVTPGPVTFRARFAVFSGGGTADASVQFNNPWMAIQVLRNN